MEKLTTYYDQPYVVIELPERYLDLIPDKLCIKIGADDENRPYKILLGNREELDFINRIMERFNMELTHCDYIKVVSLVRTRTKPNKNIEPPPFQLVSEGYKPI